MLTERCGNLTERLRHDRLVIFQYFRTFDFGEQLEEPIARALSHAFVQSQILGPFRKAFVFLRACQWQLLGVELSPLNYQLYELSFFPQITWLTAWNSRVSPYLINLITVSVRFLLTEWQSFTLCTASACCYKGTKTCWSKEHLSSFINEKISVTNNCMRSEKVRYCQSIVSMSWWLFFN